MRILYVLTSLGMGGAEKLSLALLDRIERRGHTVALLVLMPPVKEEWPSSAQRVYLNIQSSLLSMVRGFWHARRFAAEFQPDLIHSHSFHSNLLARLLKLLLGRSIVISTVHNVYEGGWWRMLAYRLTDRLSRLTVAVSQAAARRFVQLKAIPGRKCRVIVNGIDTVQFTPDAQRRLCVRTGVSLRLNPDAFLWIAAGRITVAKDYPNLLRAFARVRADCAGVRLWIAGESAPGPLAELQSLAADLNLNNSVEWLGLRRDMPALLDAADGFVSASAWEGMPLAVAEAMAMEKPVVATDVGGLRELIGETGAIVSPRNPEALARAMLEVMQQSREQRCALGRLARSRIARHFSIEANADRWEALYRQLAVSGVVDDEG